MSVISQSLNKMYSQYISVTDLLNFIENRENETTKTVAVFLIANLKDKAIYLMMNKCQIVELYQKSKDNPLNPIELLEEYVSSKNREFMYDNDVGFSKYQIYMILKSGIVNLKYII